MDMHDWNEKHRPESLSEIWGNPSAIKSMADWAEEWEHRIPEKRVLLLYGPPGTGKTSAAIALAKDMGWGSVEMNASDARNADAIKNSVALGAVNETFTTTGEFISTRDGGRKLIIIDEADSLYERDAGGAGGENALDSGGKRAILELVTKTSQPVILIVNDLYALTKDSLGKELKKKSIPINFKRVNTATIAKRVQEIARREGLGVEPEAARLIASKASGDVRAAINDLQALAAGRKRLMAKDVEDMGARDNEKTIYDLMRNIFGGMSGRSAYEMSKQLDESPDGLLLWIDENLPGAYRNPEDLARAYDCLARADIFLTRASRKNHYGLWPYATFMMTGGVAVSKRSRYKSTERFNFPSWLIKMSRSKEDRGVRTSVVTKLGKLCHASQADVIDDILPYMQLLFRNDPEFRHHLSYTLSFNDREMELMADEGKESPLIKETIIAVKKMEEKYGLRSEEGAFFMGNSPDRGKKNGEEQDKEEGLDGIDGWSDEEKEDAARKKDGSDGKPDAGENHETGGVGKEEETAKKTGEGQKSLFDY
ncbi:MAG: replication factor C large subunit [Candidatus Thermoplasmatota archaeon]|nr:replication factor C large subunit [Candidatus Thermoplasmatota archaeon]